MKHVSQLTAKVRERLGQRVQGLQVVLHDDGIMLRGQARDFYSKQLAQHAAMEVCGLPIVANEIEVTHGFVEATTIPVATEEQR